MNSGMIKAIIASVAALFALVAVISVSGRLVEYLPADEIMVIQYPSGKLRVCTEPSYYPQWFGSVSKYKRRSQYWFSSNTSAAASAAEADSTPAVIRFNDNAHAQMTGSLTWEMPTGEADLLEIHKKYLTQDRIEKEMISQQAGKSIYMTGSLMSSKESAAEKRPELLNYLEDQMQNGVYRTQNRTITETDELTSITKTVVLASIMTDKSGAPQRVEESLLKQFKIHASSVTINNIKYDEKVEAQLQQQQQAIMDIQTAMVESKKAEQRKLTVEAEGASGAASAKWLQEAIKAKEVTKAEQEKEVAEKNAERDKNVAETLAQQKLEVAKLDSQAAEQFKTAETLRGEGEAARRKLVMEADGALEKRLEAFVQANKDSYSALAQYKGNLVPSVIMGNSQTGGAGQSSASDLIDLIKVKTAKDLAINMDFNSKSATPEPTPAATPTP